jgi:Tfp pilus assembly protein PilV
MHTHTHSAHTRAYAHTRTARTDARALQVSACVLARLRASERASADKDCKSKAHVASERALARSLASDARCERALACE